MVTLGDLGGPAQDGTARGHHSEGGGKGGMVWSTRTKSFVAATTASSSAAWLLLSLPDFSFWAIDPMPMSLGHQIWLRHVRWRCGMVRVSAALDWQGGFNSDNILKIEEVTI
uniref:Uncharacterized protein n=1 Tax=Oryza rufipogon TaxID=4529 RepID=A0A0E0P712_ORYRU